MWVLTGIQNRFSPTSYLPKSLVPSGLHTTPSANLIWTRTRPTLAQDRRHTNAKYPLRSDHIHSHCPSLYWFITSPHCDRSVLVFRWKYHLLRFSQWIAAIRMLFSRWCFADTKGRSWSERSGPSLRNPTLRFPMFGESQSGRVFQESGTSWFPKRKLSL